MGMRLAQPFDGRMMKAWKKRTRWLSFLCFVTLGAGQAAVHLPSGFEAEALIGDIQAATTMTFAPDGRLFFAEQTGALRVWKDGRLLPRPALDLSHKVDDYWERGFIGLELHPDFPRTPHLFVVYVAKEPYTHHVISRFTMAGDIVDPDSEQILLEGDDQSKLGGHVPAGHQGGPIEFGPDGKLYIASGEQTAGKPSQSLQTFQGKILRIHPDGTIPVDNPFYDETEGKYRAIWAVGLRNPFGLVFQPGSGRLFATDVGGSAFEEVNEIFKGGNYGWPQAEGYSDRSDWVSPIYAYPPNVGGSICGGVFYPKSPGDNGGTMFPEPWRGKLFFVDWKANWARAIDPNKPQEVLKFAEGLNKPVWVEVAPDGSMYILNRGTIWRDEDRFEANSGSVVRIRYRDGKSSGGSEPKADPLPQRLASTGLFESLDPLRVSDELTEFHINLPPNRPGVHARRWIVIPEGKSLHLREDGEFAFPNGVIVVQHYMIEKSEEPFETHVFWTRGLRTARAAAYRWNETGSGAQWVENSELVPLPGGVHGEWMSPGAERFLDLDLLIAGFLLPVNGPQLNREIPNPEDGTPVNQLAYWSSKGWIKPRVTEKVLANIPQLFSLDNPAASLADRVRSYLDVNCSNCHRPGGMSRGSFDARIITPLKQQNLIKGHVMTEDFGIQDAKLIIPGEPDRSILYKRLNRTDALRMPPVAFYEGKEPVVPFLKKWILELSSQQSASP